MQLINGNFKHAFHLGLESFESVVVPVALISCHWIAVARLHLDIGLILRDSAVVALRVVHSHTRLSLHWLLVGVLVIQGYRHAYNDVRGLSPSGSRRDCVVRRCLDMLRAVHVITLLYNQELSCSSPSDKAHSANYTTDNYSRHQQASNNVSSG